jgi:hypothetical protein
MSTELSRQVAAWRRAWPSAANQELLDMKHGEHPRYYARELHEAFGDGYRAALQHAVEWLAERAVQFGHDASAVLVDVNTVLDGLRKLETEAQCVGCGHTEGAFDACMVCEADELRADLAAVAALADELAAKGVEFAVANQSWRANVYTEIAGKLRGILGHLAVYPTGQCK